MQIFDDVSDVKYFHFLNTFIIWKGQWICDVIIIFYDPNFAKKIR